MDLRIKEGEELSSELITFRTNVQSVKLHASENAWKPLCKTQQSIEEKEKLKRSIQAVLNKLTFQKFKILLAQMKKLNIDSEEDLDLVVDMIYENTIYEPYFGVLYANLCKHLALKSPFSYKPNEHENFSILLLRKCQKGFDDWYGNSEQDFEQPHDIEERKKLKDRWIGNIRFIGELYKFGLIQTSTMFDYISILLNHEDEDSLECFCWLMKIAGKELESSKDICETNLIDKYFDQIQKIVETRLTSSRIRFMLLDLVDLKQNKWIPRRLENKPKTIDEIRKEAEFESQKQIQMFRMMSNVEIRDDTLENFACHNECLCDEAESCNSSQNTKLSYSSFSGSNLEVPEEVKNLLFGRGPKGKKPSRKSKSKRKSSHAHSENKNEPSGNSSKSEL